MLLRQYTQNLFCSLEFYGVGTLTVLFLVLLSKMLIVPCVTDIDCKSASIPVSLPCNLHEVSVFVLMMFAFCSLSTHLYVPFYHISTDCVH